MTELRHRNTIMSSLFILSLLVLQCQAFQMHPSRILSSLPSVSSSSALQANSIKIQPFAEDEASMAKASKFMLESFWIPLSEPTEQPSNNVCSKLTYSIQDEFVSRYGEIMGRRKLESCLLKATNEDTDELVGIVGLDMTLIDTSNQIQYTRKDAEKTLTNAVASLGFKERKEYKNSSVPEIVNDLLPNLIVAAVLSNLAVDPNVRKQGVGMQLCEYVENVVKGEWGVEQIYLRVESENEPARKLYEQKLGYECAWVEEGAMALRANVENGQFDESEKETLSLFKKL
jgi:ribosomal protein S18 acetylase RimI-like enzyme